MSFSSSLEYGDPIVHKLVTARIQLLFENPFFGQMVTRLRLVDASAWLPTAATDGVHLFYNRQFIASLNMAELFFLVGHEVLHCVFDHLGRRGGRDPKIWNMAIDYIVNDVLASNERNGKMPKGGLLDPKYNQNMSSEEVYEDLIKNSVTIREPLDVHLEYDDDDDDGKKPGDGKGEKSVSVTVLGKNGPPKLTAEDRERIRNQIRSNVILACQSLAAGDIPGAVLRLVEEITNPKMDWRAMLDAHVRSMVKDDYTFQRISRRSWHSNVILPGMDFRNTVKLGCGVDASGSITPEMLRDFLGEVKGIMETFVDFELWLWTFDTKVYNVVRFTGENIEDIHNYAIYGGGGTIFPCNWEFMKREGLEPPRLLIFTDGYPNDDDWGDPNYVDTLVIIHGNQKIKAPFGLTAYYEPKQD